MSVDQLRPAEEVARLAAVRRFEILDTPPDGAFDRITSLAARLFDVPIAIVSVVDEDRIWFKSRHGLPDVDQVERAPGLCASAILQYEPWVVEDAGVDPRALANPLVAGSFGLRFYAGVPLTTSGGHNLGTLCVIDRRPRSVTDEEIEVLRQLAGMVVDNLEARLQARRTVAAEGALRREAEQLADALQASLLPPRPPAIPGMELATRYRPGERGLEVGGDFFDVFCQGTNDWGVTLGDVCGRGARAASLAALTRWTIRAAAAHSFLPSEVLSNVNRVLVADDDGSDDHFCSALFGRLELDVCGAWVTLACAGHPHPVLVRRSGRVERRGLAGRPLGLLAEFEVVDDRVGLGPGDALVMYTDGITEARSPQGRFFGDKRLLELLRNLVGEPADELAGALLAAAGDFAGGPLHDDVAVVVLRVPDDAGADPMGRIVAATGLPPERIRLPGYPHDAPPPSGA